LHRAPDRAIILPALETLNCRPTRTISTAEVHAQRLHFMAGLDTWKTFGLGWARRLAAIPAQGAHHWPA
jgi:hypothetical protein